MEPIEVQLVRAKKHRDGLRDLARIHTRIDPPTRKTRADEPDLVFRLRKVCFHALALTSCEINVDGVHVMTTELRAAYEQMDAVRKVLPDEFRVGEDGSWWITEATDRLAQYNQSDGDELGLVLHGGRFRRCRSPREPPTARRLAGPPRMRIRASARLFGAGAGHRRGHRFPFASSAIRHALMAGSLGDGERACERAVLRHSSWGYRSNSRQPSPLTPRWPPCTDWAASTGGFSLRFSYE